MIDEGRVRLRMGTGTLRFISRPEATAQYRFKSSMCGVFWRHSITDCGGMMIRLAFMYQGTTAGRAGDDRPCVEFHIHAPLNTQ